MTEKKFANSIFNVEDWPAYLVEEACTLKSFFLLAMLKHYQNETWSCRTGGMLDVAVCVVYIVLVNAFLALHSCGIIAK